MRFALAIIAALANAAGPWLCCCAMMAATSGATFTTAATPVPAQKSPQCSHCCEDAAPTDNSQAPQSPKPAKPCPCQERMAVTPSQLPATPDNLIVLDSIATDFHHATGDVELLPTPTLAFANVCELPFLTAETRLRVHHVMHC